jgi:hypothetical protein
MKGIFNANYQLPHKERAPYEAPAIVYEGLISTRAGSLLPGSTGTEGADPADLFGKNS